MMTDPKKRKERSGDGYGDGDNRGLKRSKGGTGGKWQTPHQRLKSAARGRGQIEPGDVGIWATCAKNQEMRAAEELQSMLEECAERFYGIVTGSENVDNEEEEGSVDDIEKSIQKEVSNQKMALKMFTPIHLDIPCVIFFKTRPPLDPVDFVHRICQEVVANPGVRKMRYVNRLTPMTLMGKATEKGLEEVGKIVLSEHFHLIDETHEIQKGIGNKDDRLMAAIYPSYAIRPTIRAHNSLKRDVVIKQIASSISDVHKVDLTTPKKVILVEIYTTVCGISVVGSDWETLKRFNIAELYRPPPKPTGTVKAEARPQTATKDEEALVALASTITDSADP